MRPEEFERIARELSGAGPRLAQGAPRHRGTVHTPWPLARWWADRAEAALRRAGLPEGLCTEGLLVLEPACGPGIFLLAVLERLAGRSGGTTGRPRLLGLEVAAEPLRLAEARLAPLADRLGVSLRLRCLDSLRLDPRALPEREAARHLLVLGNPPWAAGGLPPPGEPLRALMEDFRREADGKPIASRRLGVLQEACLRFWRWSAEAARETPGAAVVALLSNASLLDGPLHRGVRARLLSWFEELQIVELGGGALVARTSGADAPLMPVRVAAAGLLGWRPAGHAEGGVARVLHAAPRGRAEEKLRGLASGPPMRPLRPAPPALLLRPRAGPERWPPGWAPLDALFPFHREGLQSNRDRFATDPDPERLQARLQAWLRGEPPAGFERELRPRRHFDPERARERLREAVREHGGLRALLRPLAYRPGEVRWIVPLAPLCHRPRPALLAAAARSEGLLLTVGHDRGEAAWHHVGWSLHPPDSSWLSSRSSCRTRAFPTHAPGGEPNVDAEAARRWLGGAPPPGSAALLHYALAVLSCDTYQRRFAGLLRAGLPHLPPPPDTAAFERVAACGAALAAAFERWERSEAAKPGEDGAPLRLGHRRLRAPRALREALDVTNRAARVTLW